ncbi:MAG: hypothetical protein LBL93_06095 [Ruminococcus sp.]|jgi:hypothetical protein|nr:hypothetical protein [Ruminococcus sp.]
MNEQNQWQNYNPYPNPMPAGGMGMMPGGPISENDKYLLDMKIAQQSAKTSKILGILSIILGLLTGIIGLILGILAITNASKAEKISYAKDSKIGKICGIIGVIISVAVIILSAVFFSVIVQKLTDIFGTTKEKDFTIKDKIVITMTEEYKEVPAFTTELTEAYSTARDGRVVEFNCTPLSSISGFGLTVKNMTAESWRNLYLEQFKQFKVNNLINETNIVGAEVTYTAKDENGVEHSLKSMMIFYKNSDNDVWVINFAAFEDKYDEYRDEFFKFARSIRKNY